MRGDGLHQLQTIARNITEPKQNPFKYRESREIKRARADAMRVKRMPQARTLSKQVWKLKKGREEECGVAAGNAARSPTEQLACTSLKLSNS